MRILSAKWEKHHQLPGKGIPVVVKLTRQHGLGTEAIGVVTAAEPLDDFQKRLNEVVVGPGDSGFACDLSERNLGAALAADLAARELPEPWQATGQPVEKGSPYATTRVAPRIAA